MATNDFNHKDNGGSKDRGDDDYDDDQDDDRKLPAKEIRVNSHKTTNPELRAGKSRNTNESETSPDFTLQTSTDSSVASTASSISVGWAYRYSPVAAANNGINPTPKPMPTGTPPYPNCGQNSLQTPSVIKRKKQQKKQISSKQQQQHQKQDDMPSLASSSPGTPYVDHVARWDYRSNNSSNTTVALSPPWTARHLQQHIRVWLATVILAIVVFLYQLLPTAALATLLFILTSTGMMAQMLLSAARQWYFETVTAGAGIGQLLPQSLYQTLTETSLHDYMTAPSSMGVENLHLLLYFLPLSPEQLNESIRRLGPHHRQRLFQRGLGHMVLGEGVMRILLGEQRYRAFQDHAHATTGIALPQVAPSYSSSAVSGEYTNQMDSRRLYTSPQHLQLTDTGYRTDEQDDEQDNDNVDVSGMEASMRYGHESPEALPILRTLGSAGTQTTLTARSREGIDTSISLPLNSDENNLEMQVVMDALWNSAYGTIWNPMRNYVSTALVQPTVQSMSHLGRSLAVLFSVSSLGGMGLWWWTNPNVTIGSGSVLSMFTGVMSAGTPRTTERNQFHSLSGNVWSSVAFGGLSLGFTLYARYNAQRRGAYSKSSLPSKEKTFDSKK